MQSMKHIFPFRHTRHTHYSTRNAAHLLLLWLAMLAVLTILAGCGGTTQEPAGASLSVVEAMRSQQDATFATVTEPRRFVFPQDHGPHPEYRIEWWYYTGNLETDTGRHFGYQLTFFRIGLTPDPPQRTSDWATSSVYMAHLAVSDVASGQFYDFERFSRAGAGLAGASGDPFRVFLENWSAQGSGPQGMQMHLQAAAGPVALDLQLESSKPPILQGNQGVSQKGQQEGNASYYYSLTRMATTGSVTIDGQRYAVSGLSWMDREFSTSALEEGAQGWDWFSLQLDNGRDLMLYVVRHDNPDKAQFFGVLVAPDGSTRHLEASDVQLEVLDKWQSPHSGATYPAQWNIHLPDEGLELLVTPYLADQELDTAVTYWEGAVQVEGTQQGEPVAGHGYVELTGYAEAQQNN
jgi:predicted secreted hydrolase